MSFLRWVSSLGLSVARWPVLGGMVGWVFAHLSDALPLQRLRETPTLLAFHHPRPAHAVHILIVPRRAIAGLEALTSQDQDFLADLFRVVPEIVSEFGLAQRGYRLVVNGGAYQDIPQLHFHLIAD